MRRNTIIGLLSLALAWQGTDAALADDLPGGYSGPTLVSGTTADYLAISQMAFNPNDPNHLYAARVNNAFTSSFITRYDYSPASGRVSNPVNVAAVPGASLGLAFFNNDLYISTNDLTNNVGGIIRYQPSAVGTYGNPVAFINNVPIGDHQVDHLQVLGNSLYAGIGTRTDNYDKSQETPYNGTVGVITDLTKANGADNLPLSAVLTDTDPGKLHVFASGFRNPFGLLVTGPGRVLVTDNGQDQPVTPDLLYKDLVQGDKGVFPTNNPGNPVSPAANLGLHTGATGPAVVPLGSNQGDVLVGLFFHDTSNPSPALGSEVVLVDPRTGVVTPSITSLASVSDIITDPTGKILLADFGPNGYNPTDPNGGIYLLAPTAVPEPSSVLLTGVASALGGLAWLRRRLAAR